MNSVGQSGLAEVSASLRRPPFSLLLAICEAADANEADDLVHDSLRLVGAQDLAFLRVAASAEINRTRDCPQLFRSTSVASKLLSRFTRSSRESMAWLRSALEKPVASILDSRVVLADLDGKDAKGGARKGLLSRTLSTGAVDTGTPKSSSGDDSAPSTIHLSVDAKRSLAKLEALAKAFFESIFAASSCLPRSFRELCHHMQVESFKKFGDGIKLTRGEYSCCSSFVFLRFVCPAILSPHSFGLSKTSPPPDVMRTLVLISKVLTSAANGTTMSEPQLATINAYLFSVQARMTEFFTLLCSNPDADLAAAVSSSTSDTSTPKDSDVNGRDKDTKFRTLFASTPVMRPGPDKEKEKEKPVPAMPDMSRVTSINREERALLQVLSWAAKHAFTVQTSIREREELTEEERAALSTEWETFLAALIRLPPDLLVPQPRSSRTARSSARDSTKEKDATSSNSPNTKYQPKEARKSRLLETIGDWLDGSESRARKLRAKSEAAPRPPTQDLLLALETPEVSAWLVEMEKKGGDSRQSVLYIYALLEELYRLRSELERPPTRPRSSSRVGMIASPSASSSPSSPATSSRRSSMKRRVYVNELDQSGGVTSPRRLQESAATKERRERREKEEREREREKKKEREREAKTKTKTKDKDKDKEKHSKGKDRKKESEWDSDRDKSGSRSVTRTSSVGPSYNSSITHEKRNSREADSKRRSVNYSPSINPDK